MAMGWDAVKAAWRGEVSGADIAAMFAATAGLTHLHEAMEDRRLEARIAQSAQPGQAGAEWRVALTLGRIAAPLWLADALVALAGAFYDAEAQPHSGRPSSVSGYIHDLVASLLLPVEDIVADVTAALADPRRPSSLMLPLLVGPGGDIADYAIPRSPGVAFVRELATGARGVHTAAAATLATLRATFAESPPPTWLEVGLRRLDGDVQAAGARLDMAEVRATAAQVTHGEDPAALETLCLDLWRIVGVAVVAGQLSSDPHLMPEAAAAAQSSVQSVPPAQAPPVPRAPTVARVDALPFPQVDPGAAPLVRRRDTPTAAHCANHADNALLPRIGEGAATARETSATCLPESPLPDLPTSVSLPASVSLPTIGESSTQATRQPESTQFTKGASQAPHAQKSQADEQNDAPTVPFPEIG
ncbi:MAG TPA: hypothetical protein VJN88_15295 [Ktedonobacterales bacterium]|nr:hypothetical protein [Ktedonobacterales bacterium]